MALRPIWMKDGGEGMDEARVGELESGGGEPGGVDAGAGEQELVDHGAEGEAKGEGRDRENGRAMEQAGQDSGKLGVGDGVGRGEVHGAGEILRVKQEEDSGKDIGERDPAHELAAAAETASEAETEDGQQTGEGAGTGAEDDTEAKMENADAGVDSGLSGRFPFLAKIGEKTGAGERGFVEEGFAAVAVDANGGGDEERFWGTAEAGQGGGEDARGEDAANGEFAGVVLCPAVGSEVGAGEMNGGGKIFKPLNVSDGGGGGEVPQELVGKGGGRTDQLQNRGIPRGQGTTESCAKHARAARQEVPGRLGIRVRGSYVLSS